MIKRVLLQAKIEKPQEATETRKVDNRFHRAIQKNPEGQIALGKGMKKAPLQQTNSNKNISACLAVAPKDFLNGLKAMGVSFSSYPANLAFLQSITPSSEVENKTSQNSPPAAMPPRPTNGNSVRIVRQDPSHPDKKIVITREANTYDNIHSGLIALSSRKGLFRGSQIFNYYLSKKYNYPYRNLSRYKQLFDDKSAVRANYDQYLKDRFITTTLDKESKQLKELKTQRSGYFSNIQLEEALRNKDQAKVNNIFKIREFIKQYNFQKTDGGEKHGKIIAGYRSLEVSEVTANKDELRIKGYKSSGPNPGPREYSLIKSQFRNGIVPEPVLKDIAKIKSIVEHTDFDASKLVGKTFDEYYNPTTEKIVEGSNKIEGLRNTAHALDPEIDRLDNKIRRVTAHANFSNRMMSAIAIGGTALTLANIGVGIGLDGYDERHNPDGTIDPNKKGWAFGRRTWGNIGGFIGGVFGSYVAVKKGHAVAGWGMSKEARSVPSYKFSGKLAMSMPQNVVFGNGGAFTGRFLGITAYDYIVGGSDMRRMTYHDKEVLARDAYYSFGEYGLGAIFGGYAAGKTASIGTALALKPFLGKGKIATVSAMMGAAGYIYGTLKGPQIVHGGQDWFIEKLLGQRPENQPDADIYNAADMGRRDLILARKQAEKPKNDAAMNALMLRLAARKTES